MRPQEMPRYIEDGTLDAGITGSDWIVENGSDLVEVASFIYSKVSLAADPMGDCACRRGRRCGASRTSKASASRPRW